MISQHYGVISQHYDIIHFALFLQLIDLQGPLSTDEYRGILYVQGRILESPLGQSNVQIVSHTSKALRIIFFGNILFGWLASKFQGQVEKNKKTFWFPFFFCTQHLSRYNVGMIGNGSDICGFELMGKDI